MAQQAAGADGTEKKGKTRGPIQVRFFGRFQVAAGGSVINDGASRARQPWNLLQFLMVHRHQPVTRQQLMDALWPDGASDQPDKALKNLVYRVRSAFAAGGAPEAQEVVLYRGGSYVLNNELDWWFDFEQAEALHRTAMDVSVPQEARISSALAGLELYRGDFLSEQVYEDWALPLNTYYRSCFFQCARLAMDLLDGTGRLADQEAVCNRAVSVDPFSEEFHLAYMRLLVEQDKKSTAMAHYNKMAEMFFREMGVTPSDELRALYTDLSGGQQAAVTDLGCIKQALGEGSVDSNAFYCDFEVFRSLYRLEARAAQRADQAVFVALLTLVDEKGAMEEGERLTSCMDALLELVNQNLCRGDVVSRFSQCQYILLLPTITVENAEMVMGRLAGRFAHACPSPGVSLETTVQPLEAVMY